MVTSKQLCSGYDEGVYARMMNDSSRTEAYRAAIASVASGKVVLDVGSGADALLAIFAAEAGASHVYAIEVNVDSCAAARARVHEMGPLCPGCGAAF